MDILDYIQSEKVVLMGTEPKIKFYYGVKGTSLQDAEEKLEALKKDLVEE